MKTSFTNLSTKDLATLGQRTITVSDEPAFVVVKDHPLLVALKTVYADYDGVYTKKAYSGKGYLLVDADKDRDAPFSGFKFTLLGFSKIKGLPYRQDAIDIYGLIQKYGIDLDRYTYAEESAQLKKLLEELDKPENVAKIERMQLTLAVTEIKEAQTTFENLFNTISGENSELRMMESASSLRKSLEVALRNYFNVVAAMSSQPGWKELNAKLEQIVKAANNSKPSTKQVLPPTPPAAN